MRLDPVLGRGQPSLLPAGGHQRREPGLGGNLVRASGLIAEHRAEFPDDQLVGPVQAWITATREIPR
jgi:hypothetical protein